MSYAPRANGGCQSWVVGGPLAALHQHVRHGSEADLGDQAGPASRTDGGCRPQAAACSQYLDVRFQKKASREPCVRPVLTDAPTVHPCLADADSRDSSRRDCARIVFKDHEIGEFAGLKAANFVFRMTGPGRIARNST